MTDDIKMPCEIALEADAELMKLFEEIDNEGRGHDSAFMDDMFGGQLTQTSQLPDQLERWHTRGRDPSDPMLIIGA